MRQLTEVDKSFVQFLQRFTRFDEIPEGNRQFCSRKAVNKTLMTMKSRILILILFLLVACQPMETDFDYRQTLGEKAAADSVCTLTLQAIRTIDTKALDLINNGNTSTLNQYWKETDKVKVFRNGTCIGTLDVQPAEGEKPTTATLSGSVKIDDLKVNDVLTLQIPREIIDYTGQKGLITGTGSIEDTYDYATASVTVGSINGNTVTTTADARFQNQQSIYRFEFKRKGNVQIQTLALTVMAANGKLVQRASYEGGVLTPVYGAIQIEKAEPSTITNFVSLRNESTSEDRYSFFIIDEFSYKLYVATKTIPAYVLDTPGKFISAKNIEATELAFTPITESPGANPTVY